MRIDYTAASNPDIFKPRISGPTIADDEPKTEDHPAACKCVECGFTMLIKDGCRYCQPEKGAR